MLKQLLVIMDELSAPVDASISPLPAPPALVPPIGPDHASPSPSGPQSTRSSPEGNGEQGGCNPRPNDGTYLNGADGALKETNAAGWKGPRRGNLGESVASLEMTVLQLEAKVIFYSVGEGHTL